MTRPAQRAPRAAPLPAPTDGTVPALPGALCPGQVATGLAAQQPAEGEGRGSPGQGLPFPGPCLWVRLGQTAPSRPTAWRERKMFQAQPQERSQPWQGDATPPVLRLCLVQLALCAQRRRLPARGSLCGVPWQGAKRGN